METRFWLINTSDFTICSQQDRDRRKPLHSRSPLDLSHYNQAMFSAACVLGQRNGGTRAKKDNMQKIVLQSLMIALLSGLAIGAQSSLIGSAGKITGAALTGLLVNFSAGAASGVLLAVIYARQGNSIFSGIQASTVGTITVAGILGVGVIAGIAYALPKIGVAAGLSMIVTGQMAVAVLVDTLGLTGGAPIPLSWTRIGGLVLLVLGTWAIAPKE